MAYCMTAGSFACNPTFTLPSRIGANLHVFIRPKRVVPSLRAARRISLVKSSIQEEAMAVEGTTLYDKLGGKPAIKQMADILAEKLAKDDTLGPYFVNAAMPKHKVLLAQFFVDAFGGPKAYKGKSMVDAHVGLKGFKHPEMFNIVASLVVETAEELKLSKELSDEVMAVAGTLEPEFAKVAKLRSVIDSA